MPRLTFSPKLSLLIINVVFIEQFLFDDHGADEEADAAKCCKKARQHVASEGPGQVVHPGSWEVVLLARHLREHQRHDEYEERTSKEENSINDVHHDQSPLVTLSVLVDGIAPGAYQVTHAQEQRGKETQELKTHQRLAGTEPRWHDEVVDILEKRRMDPPASNIALK